MAGKHSIATKFVLKFFVFVFLFAIVLTIGACGNEKNSENSEEVNAGKTSETTDNDFSTTSESTSTNNNESIPDITKPTLVVRGVNAKAGAKNIEVIVEIQNNPGILGIDFDFYYDDTVMVLVNSQSTLDLAGCNYTPPSYYRNPTTFLWDFQDANWTEDGVFLKLYFDILETASLGEYEIKLMYSYGNIFDANGTPIDIEVKNANISIEE